MNLKIVEKKYDKLYEEWMEDIAIRDHLKLYFKKKNTVVAKTILARAEENCRNMFIKTNDARCKMNNVRYGKIGKKE